MAFIYDLTDTWNNAGTSFNGIKLNATDTASAAGSKLLDLQINGASKLAVGKTGTVTATGIIESTVGGFKFPDATTQTTKATVNSVSGTGSVNGITLTGSVTNTGSLTLGGTLGNIANNQLTNSAITINGTSTALGGSIAVGTVTSVGGTGTVSGLSLTGSVTTSGSLTLGGTLVLTSGQVTDGLGYTPYNATNPTGYITAAALTPYLTSATAATTYQPLDGDLTAIAALAGTAGLVRKTAANTYSLDTAVYITGITSGDVTTALGFTPYNATNPSNYLSSVSLTSNVTGTLPIANGGTGATTDSGARTALGLGTAAVLNSGVAGGVATLDGSGTVPTSQLPGAVLGGLNYQGTWNASTNVPTLASSVGSKGYYYVVSTAGSTNLNGITDWKIGDWAVYDGSTWQKVDNTDAVSSVNGFTGAVVLTTTDVAQGTNLYFTQAAARGSVSAGTGISYNSTSGVITNSAPDQTVALTGAGTTVVTGTYPNFTITSNDSIVGTVTSVAASGGTTGLSFTGSPITTAGTLTLGGTLALANGGTGASTASGARTALELGTAATTDASAYATAAQGAKADTAVQTIASTDGSVTITGTTAIDLSVGVAGSTSNVILPIRNTTGATLTKGTAVYISGATGQLSTVSKAIANSDATSAQTLGLVTANISNNANGNVTLIGTITNIDTSAYTDGQQLYLSPTTAGTLTATKPHAPQHLVYMAVVEHAHPSQGKLFVKVQNGYEMDELHNVSAQSPANNDGLFYNTTTSLWEKKSIVTALGYTPYNATNPAGYTTNTGTVTSVGGTGTVSGLTLTGTVTTSGNLTLGGTLAVTPSNFASQTANTVLAAPNGAAGVPTFRAIVAADIPTLNQNTTGTASNVTGTVAVANGGTGATTLTSGYLIKGNGTSAVSASVVYDTGTNVGIGETAPGSALQVNGNIRVSNGTGFVTANSLVRSIQTMSGSANQFVSSNIDFYTAAFTDNGQIAFSTGGAEAMRINGSSNVGIGTTSPGAKLDVNGGSANTEVRFNHADNVVGRTVTLRMSSTQNASYTGAGAYMQAIQGAGVDVYSLAFGTTQGSTSATERMRITSVGDVLAGLTSASGLTAGGGSIVANGVLMAKNALSDHQTNAGVLQYTGNITTIRSYGATASTGIIAFNTGGGGGSADAEAMRITPSGELLIGSTDVFGKLTLRANANSALDAWIRNDSAGSSARAGIVLNASGNSWRMGMGSSANNSNALTWNVDIGGANTEKMRLTTGGDFGIGTSSPQRPLHVYYNSSIVGAYTAILQGTVGGYGAGVSFQSQLTGGALAEMARITADGEAAWDTTAANQDAGLRFYTALNGTVAEKMRLNSDGNLLLSGASTGDQFIRVGSGRSGNGYSFIDLQGDTTYSNGLRLIRTNSGANSSSNIEHRGTGSFALITQEAAPITLLTSATERMRIDSSGNVGIGTTTPQQLLALGNSTDQVGAGVTGAVSTVFFGTPTNIVGGMKRISYDRATGNLNFIDGSLASPTTQMAIDASGNVGIGTSSPGAKLDVSGNIRLSAGTPNIEFNNGGGMIYGPAGNTLAFATGGGPSAPQEKMRITSGGTVQVGTTSSSYAGALAIFEAEGGSGASSLLSNTGGTNYATLYVYNKSTTGNNELVQFGTEGTWTSRGSITYNRAGGVVAYNTTSDYRAKDILGPVTDIGATIDALKVYSGKMKGATIARPMLVAHEAQEVVPYAVTGEKDAVNKDGTDKYQQMDHQVLIPLLIAEIQSLRVRVAQLEGN